MTTRWASLTLAIGVGVMAIGGCAATRPGPLTVKPGFSYTEQTAPAKRAAIWPVDGTALAEASPRRQAPRASAGLLKGWLSEAHVLLADGRPDAVAR